MITGLAELGAFGMKIDEKYGGLGLSNLDYCRALMLVGSANPAVSVLLSAHQSIGVPQPLKLVRHAGAEGDVPAPARRPARSRRSCSPSPTSAPTRPGCATTAVPTPEGDYLLNGVKLWATNGTLATICSS